jgi:uncharacterized protein
MAGAKRTMSAVFLWLCVILIAIYVGLVALVYFGQRGMQYFPDTTPRTPQQVGAVGFTEIDLKQGTDERLMAWYKLAPPGRPTILSFHGNGGSVSTRADKNLAYAENFGLLAAEYRGYGGNTGSPSESGIIADAHLAYAWLIKQKVEPQSIFVLGESLGTGVAVQLAAAKPVGAMALEAPYANIVDIGAERFWFLPVRLLMKDQFKSALFIGKYRGPLFIVHGNQDRVVPFAQGRKLFDLANEPKAFMEIDGRGHDLIGDDQMWQIVLAFFEKQVKPQSQ